MFFSVLLHDYWKFFPLQEKNSNHLIIYHFLILEISRTNFQKIKDIINKINPNGINHTAAKSVGTHIHSGDILTTNIYVIIWVCCIKFV